MFIIVPKKRAVPVSTVSGRLLEPRDQAQNGTRLDDASYRPSLRIQSACNSCRVRKAKCSGGQPCHRCRSRNIICVYAKSHKQELPVTAQSIALLQNQQTRLETAVKRMAAIIAKHETGEDRPDSSFDIPDLIEKYAPDTARLIDPSEGESRKRHPEGQDSDLQLKRRRSDDEVSMGQDEAVVTEQDVLDETVVPARTGDNTANLQAMLQYMQMMQSGLVAPTTEPDNTLLEPGHNAAELEPGFPDIAMQRSPRDPTLDLMNLVDWTASLDSFSDFMTAEDLSLPDQADNGYLSLS